MESIVVSVLEFIFLMFVYVLFGFEPVALGLLLLILKK